MVPDMSRQGGPFCLDRPASASSVSAVELRGALLQAFEEQTRPVRPAQEIENPSLDHQGAVFALLEVLKGLLKTIRRLFPVPLTKSNPATVAVRLCYEALIPYRLGSFE